MWYVYLLVSKKSGTWYTDSTNDERKRISNHKILFLEGFLTGLTSVKKGGKKTVLPFLEVNMEQVLQVYNNMLRIFQAKKLFATVAAVDRAHPTSCVHSEMIAEYLLQIQFVLNARESSAIATLTDRTGIISGRKLPYFEIEFEVKRGASKWRCRHFVIPGCTTEFLKWSDRFPAGVLDEPKATQLLAKMAIFADDHKE